MRSFPFRLAIAVCLVAVPSFRPLAAQEPDARAAIERLRDSLASVTDSLALRRLETATIALAKADRDNPQLHLRLGFIAYRLGDLGKAKQHYDDAAGEFEWASELRPDWPYPWYGLGFVGAGAGRALVDGDREPAPAAGARLPLQGGARVRAGDTGRSELRLRRDRPRHHGAGPADPPAARGGAAVGTARRRVAGRRQSGGAAGARPRGAGSGRGGLRAGRVPRLPRGGRRFGDRPVRAGAHAVLRQPPGGSGIELLRRRPPHDERRGARAVPPRSLLPRRFRTAGGVRGAARRGVARHLAGAFLEPPRRGRGAGARASGWPSTTAAGSTPSGISDW